MNSLLTPLLGVALTLLLTASVMAAEGLPAFDKLWDYAKPAETEAKFRELLPKAKEAGDTGYLAELLTQLARTQGLQKRYEEAHRTLDEAQRLLPAEATALPRARVRYLLERGRVFNSSGKPLEAVPLFKQAWEQANSAKQEDLALDAAHMLAIVEAPAEALRWAERAIGLAEKTDNPQARKWLGPLYNNSGWTYYDQGDYPKALTLLEKAQSFYEKQGTPQQILIAKYSVGKTLRALGRVEKALAIQEKLRAEMEAAKEPDGYVYEELAECLLLLKRGGEARPYFAKAHALLCQDEWLVKNEPKRLERLKAQASD